MKKIRSAGFLSNIDSSHTAQLSPAYPFPCSTSESELSEEEDEEEEEEEDDDEGEELELLLLVAFLLAFASFPFMALSRLTVCSGGCGAVTCDCFLFGPRDDW